MSYYFPNVDPLYLFKREGTAGDPFLFLIDSGNVTKGLYVLKEIPSHTDGLKVVGSDGNELTRTDKPLPNAGEYRVDYSVGILFLHDSLNGKKITAEYYGKGFVNIPTSRIQMMGGGEDPVETLQDALNRVDDAINVLGEVGDLDFKDEYASSSAYKKWNFVTYKNKTFVSVKDSTGISPDNSDYWRLVSSGVGFSGVYDSSITYDIGDLVSDESKKNLYVSKSMENSSPLSNGDMWELVITLDDTIDNLTGIIDSKIDELNDLKEKLNNDDHLRDENELERDGRVTNALATMELFKQDVQDEESLRDLNESGRRSGERLRESGEDTRTNNEAQRQISESTRKSQEDARQQNMQSFVSEVQQAVTDVGLISEEVDTAMAEMEILKDETLNAVDDSEIVLEQLTGWKHLAEYNEEEEYKRFNIVSHKGSSYLAVQDISEDDIIDGLATIDNTDYWGLLSLAGRDGTDINIDGLTPNEDGEMSLDSLGIAYESQLTDIKTEIQEEFNPKIGELSGLRTARKENIVDAINELKGRIDELIDLVT